MLTFDWWPAYHLSESSTFPNRKKNRKCDTSMTYGFITCAVKPMIFFSTDALYDWTVEPSATVAPDLRDLSDTNSSTCQVVTVDYTSTLLRGNVMSTFKKINVTLELENSNIVFGPESCILDSSILITHASPSNEQSCGGHFCGKLKACEYNGLLWANGTREIHTFTCFCSGDVCTELVFWFQHESPLPNELTICEIHGYL